MTSSFNFKLILNVIRQPVFVHDQEKRLVYVNQPYLELVERDLESVIGQVYWEVFPRLDGPTKACVSACEKNYHVCEEFKDQVSGKWFVADCFPVFDEGDFQYSVHVFQDVTAHKQVINLLAEEKQLSSAMLDACADLLYIVDMAGYFLHANQAVGDALGYSQSELATMSVFDIDPDITPEKLDTLKADVLSKKHLLLKSHHRRQDGHIFPVDVHVGYVKFQTKDCFIVLVRDTTEQEQTIDILKHQVNFEQTMRQLTSILFNQADFSAALSQVVMLLGELLGASRSYIFQYDDENKIISNTHEWCADGVTPYKDSLQQLSFHTQFPWLSQQLEGGNIVNISSLDELPAAAHQFRKELEKEQIKSILILPIFNRGFIGFDQFSQQKKWSPSDLALLDAIKDILEQGFAHDQSVRRLQYSMAQLHNTLAMTVQALSQMIAQRDPYTADHQHRVAALAVQIAQKLSICEHDAEGIFFAGMVHDIGKIRVPAEILSSPRKLIPVEVDLIRIHPEAGYEVVRHIPFDWPIADMIYQHHERLDGSGYPLGLSGNEIMLGARILAVADVFESMTSHRPYRPARSQETALDELRSNAGVLYDVQAVDALVELIEKNHYKLVDPESDSGLFKDQP